MDREGRKASFEQELERAMDTVQQELNASSDRQHSYDIELLVDGEDMRGARVGVHDAEFYHPDVRRHIVDVYVLDTGGDVSVRATPPMSRGEDGYDAAASADRWDVELYGAVVEDGLRERLGGNGF